VEAMKQCDEALIASFLQFCCQREMLHTSSNQFKASIKCFSLHQIIFKGIVQRKLTGVESATNR
jgi:hypothetical protein